MQQTNKQTNGTGHRARLAPGVLKGCSPGTRGVLTGYSRGHSKRVRLGRRKALGGERAGGRVASKGDSESYRAGRGSPAARLDVRESEEHPRKPASRPKRESAKRESAKWESAKWESAKWESAKRDTASGRALVGER